MEPLSALSGLPPPQSSYITGKIIELDGGAERPVFPDPPRED